MSNLVEHAKREFLAIGYKPINQCEDDPNKWIQENVLELLDVFSKQGHSGSSAPFAIRYFTKLADFKPLSPIKCTDEEWINVHDDTYQNTRLSSVFKEGKDGKPYFINAIVFKGQNGAGFSSGSVDLKSGGTIGSRQFIKLPFTPKTFYIDVIETEWHKDEKTGKLTKQEGGGWWTSIVKDEDQLIDVFKYYNKC